MCECGCKNALRESSKNRKASVSSSGLCMPAVRVRWSYWSCRCLPSSGWEWREPRWPRGARQGATGTASTAALDPPSPGHHSLPTLQRNQNNAKMTIILTSIFINIGNSSINNNSDKMSQLIMSMVCAGQVLSLHSSLSCASLQDLLMRQFWSFKLDLQYAFAWNAADEDCSHAHGKQWQDCCAESWASLGCMFLQHDQCCLKGCLLCRTPLQATWAWPTCSLSMHMHSWQCNLCWLSQQTNKPFYSWVIVPV